jgi:hypothetical protein
LFRSIFAMGTMAGFGMGHLGGGASLTGSVEDGAAAVHLEVVVGSDVWQQLLADGTFQMDQRPAGDTFEVKMVTAIPPPYVLVDVGGLGIAAVFPHRPLLAELRQVTVQGTFTAAPPIGIPIPIELIAKLLHRELTVRMALQKIQKAFPPRCFVCTRHRAPPFIRSLDRNISTCLWTH